MNISVLDNNYAETNDQENQEQSAEHRDTRDFRDTAGDQQAAPTEDRLRYMWIEDRPTSENYRKFGALLAEAGDVFRNGEAGEGLLVLKPDKTAKVLTTAKEFMPVIVDRVDVSIYREGKSKGGMLSSSHLNTMLQSEEFLSNFVPVDRVESVPSYLSDFALTKTGFNDGGRDFRVVYLGDLPEISFSTKFIDDFLEVMDFSTEADRTNAVAAGLTVMLRHHFPGGKPIIVTTATKSHSGKDTVILFSAGETQMTSISYQATDWALERNFVGSTRNLGVGLVSIENARLNSREKFISSAFVERFTTDPEPMLFSTGTGPAIRRRNDIVVAISTNFGSVSEDILNRSLPIHLEPHGSVVDRESSIGNPKLHYLPRYRTQIAAEFRGMIRRWIDEGQPLDLEVRHPYSQWAAAVGGILAVNGYYGFLDNYRDRKVADDPVRSALSILGAEVQNVWERPEQMAMKVSDLGLVKQLIPEGDRDGIKARTRGLGKMLSNHVDERFTVETDAGSVTTQLRKMRGRFNEAHAHTRYCFEVVAPNV